MTVANKLKMYRQMSNLTQSQVSQTLNIDRSTYSYYELGKTVPSISMLTQLAKLFNVNLSDLLDTETISEHLSGNPIRYDAGGDKPIPMAHLSKDEKDLLLFYRKLDETGRADLLKRAKAMCEKQFELDE